jgi:hypothetical protein
MCPLVRGGTVAVAGELPAGTCVVVEELCRRLSPEPGGLSIFAFIPPHPGPEREFQEMWAKEGHTGGTPGTIVLLPRSSSSLAASAPRPPATAWITRAPNVTPRPTSTTIAIGIVGSRQRLWRRRPRSHRNDLWTAVGQKESCPGSRARHRGFRARSPIPDLPGGPAASLRARWTSPGPWVYTNPLDGGLLRSRCTSRWAHEFEEAARWVNQKSKAS